MGYDLHIRRAGAGDQRPPISADDFKSAVSSTAGVRLVGTDTNDPSHDAAEVFFKEQPGFGIDGTWHAVLYLTEGEIVRRRRPPDSPSPIRLAASE
ncbi:MAG TPA: hypothetical protein V6D22_13985 [Candidatus Obscuribacterales bacterium]